MKRSLLLFVLLMAWFSTAYPQIPNTTPAGRLGRHPFASYFDSDIDTVDLYNGNLMLNIPLFSQPGREISDGLQLSYNSRGWQPNWNNTYGYYLGGWRIHEAVGHAYIQLFLYDCTDDVGRWNGEGQWIDQLGVFHKYLVNNYIEGTCDSGSPPMANIALSSAANDLSVMTTDSNGDILLYFKDGTVLDQTGGHAPRLTTRNGNYFETGWYYGGMAAQDTLGRTVSYSTDRGSSTTPLCDYTPTSPVAYTKTFTVKDSTGADEIYTLHFEKNHFTYNPINSSHCWDHLDDWLTSVDLPNGKHYLFEYENWQGYLTKVTLPSGGYIRYVYQGGNTSTSISNGDDAVVQRWVSADGTEASEKEWKYEGDRSGSARTITVTTPELHQITHQFDTSGEETQTKYYNASGGSVQQQVDTIWTSSRPTQVDTTQGSVTHSTSTTWYGPLITQKDDSEWSTSGVVPKTRTIPSYTGQIPYLTTSLELQEWNGSSYVQTGLTNFTYDEYSLTSTSSSTPNKSTPLVDRGNVTTVRRYKDGSNYVEEHFHYDDLGNVVQVVDELGHSTYISYTDNYAGTSGHDTYAFPTSVTNALSQTASMQYDYHTGLVLQSTDVRSQNTSYTYWSMNRPHTISEPGSRVTNYTYDDDTPKVTEDVLVAASTHRQSVTTLDLLNRPIQSKLLDPAGDILVDTQYDGDGRVKQVSEPYRSGTPVWTATTYDVLNRLLTVTNPDTSQVTYSYSGNTVTQTDEAGNQHRFTSNAAGQLTKVEEPNPDLSTPFETTYSYYSFGPLYQVSQGDQTRTFTYDWLGRLMNEVHPETKTSYGHQYSYSYTYNDAGLLTSRTDVLGRVTEYTYDNINRPHEVIYSDSTPDVTYTYDESGKTGLLTKIQVTGVTDSVLGYDGAGRLTSEAVTLSGVTGTFSTSYTYDYDGRLLTATYPSSRKVTLTYDTGSTASDRLASLIEDRNATTLLQATTDNAAGLLTSRTLGSGVSETRSFNSRNQLTRISASANSTTLLDLGYGFGTNNDGRIRTRVDSVQPEHSAAYTYDAIGRLAEASGTSANWDIAWTIDRYGNRTHQTPDSSGLASARIGTQNIAYTNGGSTVNNKNNDFTYDDAGNVIYDLTNHYCYDAENRLTELDTSCDGMGSIQYAYDAAGRRIMKSVPGPSSTTIKTYYLYGLTGLMSEFSTESTISNHTAAGSTDRIQYSVGEQTGTAVMLVAADGTARENNRVFPFGEAWNSNSGSDNSENFTTYQHDGESGVAYAMARHYNALGGRFLTPDPKHAGASLADPQSWNAYSYAINDPINRIDPSGKDLRRIDNPSDCYAGGGRLDAVYIGVYRSDFESQIRTVELGGITGYDCDFPDSVDNPDVEQVEQAGGGGGGEGVAAAAPPQAPLNLSAKGKVCLEMVQEAVDSLLKTSTVFLGPQLNQNKDPKEPGLIRGAYNFDFFAPGVQFGKSGPNAVPGVKCGRADGGLHIPVNDGGCQKIIKDPTYKPWGYNPQENGSYFTAHIDSSNPYEDVAGFFIHIFKDVIFKAKHGC